MLIGLGVTEIALWGHRQQGRAAQRSGYLEGVLGAARIVSEGDTPASTLVDVVGRQITHVLGADNCRYVAGPIHDTRIALLDHDGVVTRGGHTVDVEKAGLPHDEYVALLVRRGPRVIGHFLVTATTEVTTHQGSGGRWQSSWQIRSLPRSTPSELMPGVKQWEVALGSRQPRRGQPHGSPPQRQESAVAISPELLGRCRIPSDAFVEESERRPATVARTKEFFGWRGT